MKNINITPLLLIVGILIFLIGIFYAIFQCIIGNGNQRPDLFFKISTCCGLLLIIIGMFIHLIIYKNEK